MELSSLSVWDLGCLILSAEKIKYPDRLNIVIEASIVGFLFRVALPGKSDM